MLMQSISDLKIARSLEFESGEVHNNLGLSYMEKMWYEQAVESFKRAQTKDEENASYVNNWALSLYYLGMKKDNMDSIITSISNKKLLKEV